MPVPLSVSVVIPAFNAAATLAETLQSVERQTLQPLEVFVIDDGSTDGTAGVASAFLSRIKGLQVLSVANGGTGRSRNIGARAAKGELIAPLDADDIWHPTYLEKLTGRLTDRGSSTVMAFAFHRRIDRQNRVLATPLLPDVEGIAFYRLLWWPFVGNGSAVVVRRDTLLAVGGFAEGRTQSDDLHVELRLAWAGEASTVGEYLVGHRRHSGQMSTGPAPLVLSALNTISDIAGEISMADRGLLKRALAGRSGRGMGEHRRRLTPAMRLRLIGTGLRNAPLVFMRMLFSPHIGRAYGSTAHDWRGNPEHFFDLDPLLPARFDPTDSYFSRQFARFAEADRREGERRAAGGEWALPKPSAC